LELGRFQEVRNKGDPRCGEHLTTTTNPSSATYVLVVEDEPLSRIHALNLVEEAGYVAIEASNADEAISILEARKDIRIVFTDIDMPGSMDGLKLARAIRDRWPPIELILTSGHFNLNDSDLPERGRFFPKPYRDEQIISALQGFAS
jgi:CheY-like chemotaxis protein